MGLAVPGLAFAGAAFGFAAFAFFAAGAAATFACFRGSSFVASFRAVRATAPPASLTADFPCFRGICLPFVVR
jgi:hypothetical protein